jgi:putative membrane protein
MIRKAIKYFLINSVTIYLISLAVTGMTFENGITTVALTGIALTVASLIIKPIINVLLLPINLITFGLFRWVGYAITFYVVSLVVPGFKIVNFVFSGYSSYWISLPPVTLNGIVAFIALSFIISITSSILDWLLK